MIRVPPLAARRADLERIIEDYAGDAIAELSADATGFTRADRDWVASHAASSLADLEKSTRRLIALRHAGSFASAASLRGMSHVALAQWFARRRYGLS